jgi:hypothetical protein
MSSKMLHTTENTSSSWHSPSTIIVNNKFAIPSYFNMPLMKQQSVTPRRDTVLQEAEKTGPTLNRPALKHVMFLRKHEDKHFFLWTQHFDRRCVCSRTV